MDSRKQVAETGAAGVVLAGGMSRRLGRNKALEPVGGQPIITRVFDRLSQVAGELVAVVNDAERAASLPLPSGAVVAVDRYPGAGPLGGLFTGLAATSQPWALIVACDMPFINLDLVRHMLALRPGHDIVVPVLNGFTEPLHALYSTRCLTWMEERLKANDLKISRFFDQARVRYIPEEAVRRLDPDLTSFFNVNTQEDVDRAQSLAEGQPVSWRLPGSTAPR